MPQTSPFVIARSTATKQSRATQDGPGSLRCARNDRARFACALATLALSACATPQQDRLAAFEATLAAQDSATAALGQWCAARGIASPPAIRALPVPGATSPAPPEVRARLGVTADVTIAYRHVQLVCGDTVLSQAHNWYVPARLTPEMNATLENSTTPFGTVVAPLHFRRERGPARRGAAAGCPSATVLSHSAVLRLPDGQAISAVIECYTRENLR